MSERCHWDTLTGEFHGDASRLSWTKRKEIAASILALWPRKTRGRLHLWWPKVRATVKMLDPNAFDGEGQAELDMRERRDPYVEDGPDIDLAYIGAEKGGRD